MVNIDLTKGKISSQILKFMIPIVIGVIIQQLYNLSDSIIVGHFIGEDAVDVIGATNAVNNLLINLGVGLCTGFAITVAQKFGKKDMVGLKSSVGHAIFLFLIVSIIITTGALVGSKYILQFLKVPSNLVDDASTYINIIYTGISFTFGYNLFAAILRSIGDSKVPLYIIIGGSIINVGLDLVLIGIFHYGIGVSALTTVIAQVLACIVTGIYAFKKYHILRFTKKDVKLNWPESKKQLSDGVPLAFQYCITMIGVILIQRSINQYSDILHDQSLITAFLAAGRSEAIFTVPLYGLGTMMTSYCGQNYGAKDYDRLKKGFIFTTYLVFIYSIIIGVILFFIGPSLIYLFLDETTESLIKYTSTYFKINVFFYIALGLILIYRNGLQAMGDGKVCLLGGVVELISRGVVALALPIYFGYQVLYFGGPIAWFTAGVLFTIRVIMFMKKKKATLIAQRQELLQEAVPNLV